MIRVNLLRNRRESLLLPAEPRGSSTFVSRREVVVAGLFLVLGGATLWFVLTDNEGPAVAAGSTASVASPDLAPAAASSGANAVGVPESVPGGPVNSASSAASSSSPPSAMPPATSQGATPVPQAAGSSTQQAASVQQGAPQAAKTLNEIQVQGEGGRLVIFARMDGLPDYKLFRVENPSRMVIDLPGVTHEIPRESRERPVSDSVVKEIRVAQNQLDPPLVRLVIQVESFPEFQVLPRPDGLIIDIVGGSQ